VRKLTPYQPGKPIDELQREYGVSEIIKLASNENPLGPSPLALTAIRQHLHELARYPDGSGFELKQALARKLGVRSASITLGNGSNDVLELLARAFVSAEDEVIFSQHAFAVYPIVTQAVGARAVVTPARDWGNDLPAMLAAITERTRMIFIANPNNPTGTWLGRDPLEAFLRQVPQHVLVVLDEAYFEYAAHPAMAIRDYPDGIEWLDEFPNLVLTRTFSKAYGLAGLRAGYAVSQPELADYLNRVRQPFNVNSLALLAATAALGDTAHLQQTVELNVAGMKQFVAACQTLQLDYIPSAGNFIAVRVGEAARIYESLLRQGVIVRPVANYGMPEFLRISIGTAAENDKCIRALQQVLQG
jgi:histidinol-phosphate aminotransferase